MGRLNRYQRPHLNWRGQSGKTRPPRHQWGWQFHFPLSNDNALSINGGLLQKANLVPDQSGPMVASSSTEDEIVVDDNEAQSQERTTGTRDAHCFAPTNNSNGLSVAFLVDGLAQGPPASKFGLGTLTGLFLATALTRVVSSTLARKDTENKKGSAKVYLQD